MLGSFVLIWEFLVFLESILAVFIRCLYLLIVMIFKGFLALVEIVALLPPPLVAGFTTIVIVCVIYKILGRESQS